MLENILFTFKSRNFFNYFQNTFNNFSAKALDYTSKFFRIWQVWMKILLGGLFSFKKHWDIGGTNGTCPYQPVIGHDI